MTGSITSALTIEIIAAGLVTLAAAAVSGLGWLYRRIGRLEREMAQRTANDEAQHRIMASNDDVHELTVSIERLTGVVGRLEERLDSVPGACPGARPGAGPIDRRRALYGGTHRRVPDAADVSW